MCSRYPYLTFSPFKQHRQRDAALSLLRHLHHRPRAEAAINLLGRALDVLDSAPASSAAISIAWPSPGHVHDTGAGPASLAPVFRTSLRVDGESHAIEGYICSWIDAYYQASCNPTPAFDDLTPGAHTLHVQLFDRAFAVASPPLRVPFSVARRSSDAALGEQHSHHHHHHQGGDHSAAAHDTGAPAVRVRAATLAASATVGAGTAEARETDGTSAVRVVRAQQPFTDGVGVGGSDVTKVGEAGAGSGGGGGSDGGSSMSVDVDVVGPLRTPHHHPGRRHRPGDHRVVEASASDVGDDSNVSVDAGVAATTAVKVGNTPEQQLVGGGDQEQEHGASIKGGNTASSSSGPTSAVRLRTRPVANEYVQAGIGAAEIAAEESERSLTGYGPGAVRCRDACACMCGCPI